MFFHPFLIGSKKGSPNFGFFTLTKIPLFDVAETTVFETPGRYHLFGKSQVEK